MTKTKSNPKMKLEQYALNMSRAPVTVKAPATKNRPRCQGCGKRLKPEYRRQNKSISVPVAADVEVEDGLLRLPLDGAIDYSRVTEITREFVLAGYESNRALGTYRVEAVAGNRFVSLRRYYREFTGHYGRPGPGQDHFCGDLCGLFYAMRDLRRRGIA